MSTDTVQTATDTALYKRVLRQVKPWWLHICGIFVLRLLSTPLALLAPVPLKIAVDSILGSKPLPGFLEVLWPSGVATSDQALLIFAAGLLVLVVLISQLQSLGSTLLRTYTGERMVLDFRRQLFRRVQRLSLSYHDTRGSSDPAYRIQYDAPAIQYIAIDATLPLVTWALTLVAMVVVILRIDLDLAVVALLVSPILFGLSKWKALNDRG
ncbi:MAG: ABC transporter transmembrane domain-containing protein [Chloroflexota bacterium]|nr:ABC transporter transmembrane domain-containing protein [Chloroflexota bacterium]